MTCAQCAHPEKCMYDKDCHQCLMRELAMCPDYYVRNWLKDYRTKHGAEAMKALAAEVKARRAT